MGDISKMYHQVLIPEEDQHVQWFLWRNMETERDVCGKTVLTFGDKPAPAMVKLHKEKQRKKKRRTTRK